MCERLPLLYYYCCTTLLTDDAGRTHQSVKSALYHANTGSSAVRRNVILFSCGSCNSTTSPVLAPSYTRTPSISEPPTQRRNYAGRTNQSAQFKITLLRRNSLTRCRRRYPSPLPTMLLATAAASLWYSHQYLTLVLLYGAASRTKSCCANITSNRTSRASCCSLHERSQPSHALCPLRSVFVVHERTWELLLHGRPTTSNHRTRVTLI